MLHVQWLLVSARQHKPCTSPAQVYILDSCCNLLHVMCSMQPPVIYCVTILYMVVLMEKWFTDYTHLLHIRDNVSHLRAELIILLFLITIQNHCFCVSRVCVCMCVCACVCVHAYMCMHMHGGGLYCITLGYVPLVQCRVINIKKKNFAVANAEEQQCYWSCSTRHF